ncbi:putative leader peptide [Streptomyces sp. NPDC039028]|uniref:putative leader peptide n=1 Tax=Streptomyces sp. NPDC039028 TaxID=3155370 RepID=UPI0033F0192A
MAGFRPSHHSGTEPKGAGPVMNARRTDRYTARHTARCATTASPTPLALTRRRHIDLARVAGAGCR